MAERAPGTVLISGASTGIGAATALHLAGRGWRVLAGVRREADGEALRERAPTGPGTVEPVILDVADDASVAACAADVERRTGGRLDGLVNNAGIVVAGPMEFLSVDDFRRQFDVNVLGHVATTRAAMPMLRAATGRVVFMGSIGGRLGQPFLAPYCASKHALEAVADALRMELMPWGMHVALVEPGAVRTPLWDKSVRTNVAAARELPARAQELYGHAIERGEAIARLQERLGVPPEHVARRVAHALQSSRPRSRYLVGPDAYLFAVLRRTLPDRLRDRLLLTAAGLPRRAPSRDSAR